MRFEEAFASSLQASPTENENEAGSNDRKRSREGNAVSQTKTKK
jgi:hypothetical protein